MLQIRQLQATADRPTELSVPRQPTMTAPFLSHLLVASDQGSIAVYNGTQATGTPVWRKRDIRAGDVYEIKCPFPSGLFLLVANEGAITVVYDDGSKQPW